MAPNDIIVKQSVLINSLLLGFFFLIAVGLYFTFSADKEHSFSLYVKPIAGILCFIIIALVNVTRRREIYKINKLGIYYQGILITNWESFYMAFVSDDSNSASINDDIRVVIQYYDSNMQLVEQRLPAPPNLDHSVYEIIEAIDSNRDFVLGINP